MLRSKIKFFFFPFSYVFSLHFSALVEFLCS